MKYLSPTVKISTDGSGDFTKTFPCNKGLLYKIVWTQGGLAATTDLTVTNRHGTTVYSQSNITANFEKMPRQLEYLSSDGTALTTHDVILVEGSLTVTVAQGGASAEGELEFFII